MATSIVPNNTAATPGGPGNHSGNGFGGSGDGDGGRHDRTLPPGTQAMGMWLGLASIGMLFIAMTSAYIVRQGLGGNWNPIGMPPIVVANTFVLLLSSLTMELARRHYRNSPPGALFYRWLSVTMFLGLIFVAGQFATWRMLSAAGVYLGSSAHSSFFYTLTAMHGLHLLGGVVALALLFVFVRGVSTPALVGGRTRRYAPNKRIWVDVTAMYWHFMDGLWVYLLLLLFVVG